MSDGRISGMNAPWLGTKNLMPTNRLRQDEKRGDLTRLLPTADDPRPMTAENWTSEIMEPQLADSVPTEIKRVFEIARGSLLNGYFFYPLHTLGTRQLCRVIDLAIEFKCRAMNAESFNSSHEKIRFLVKRNIIPEKEEWRWHWKQATDGFSNPSEAIRIIFNAAGRINSLFVSPSEES